MKTVMIQGSSRSGGNTRQIIEIFRKNHEADVIDLSQLNIGFYDYEHRNNSDDFLPTMKKIVEYDLIIFATPVYWYAMSGSMKTFFDRITECLKTEKETGRKLRGKSMAAISCGSYDVETEGL
jgi:multimeric flavodoxin WrbA